MTPATATAVAPSVELRPVVTPWRVRAQDLARKIVAELVVSAEPEAALAAARDIGHDIGNAVKDHLRRTYGRTFDPLLDNSAVPAVAVSAEDTAAVIEAIRHAPGTTLSGLNVALGGRTGGAIGGNSLRSALTKLIECGDVLVDRRGVDSRKNRYFAATEK